MIVQGDCIDVMAGMEPESIDAIVTDPPYGLEFMGKEWDRLWVTSPNGQSGRIDGRGGMDTFGKRPTYQAGVQAQEFHARWAEAAYRVAKPSSYLLAFGGTRTVHRMTVALEDAGWIIRDMIVWAYASGFPKSKASLKPAWEPIVMARKPGPLRMLAIDECRIPLDGERVGGGAAGTSGFASGYQRGDGFADNTVGRWPANVILTDPVFDGGWDGVVGGGETASGKMMPTPVRSGDRTVFGPGAFAGYTTIETYGDSGTYSRFFLIPKAARSDREPVLGGLPDGFAPTMGNGIGGREHDPADVRAYRQNVHPTVKPTDLMRHLVRLVTPTGGTVLDPFLGSGTTALAAELEGFPWIGIEREAEYVAIAEARLNGTQRGLGLETA